MELDSYTASLRADLLAAAALGDDHTRRTADALGAAAQASARLMLLQALSDFADEISSKVDGHSVHLRLSGNEAIADVTRDIEPADAEAPTVEPEDYPTMEVVTGEMRRVTLRMVEHVKERAEEAASMNGVSLNSWLSQAVQGALRDQMRKERPY
ncbi:hypothetical protein [Rhodococcoides kyotonense]|uniref:Toxin-antitoxin system HicB family antitoxin n=1 Tax=Rhodococcoides kyotonense TaxID=398843 RepID=A0A239D388_9NOCA|nr:hypothetical protein [Rhodococcus kyotonensis]SNS26679.1 hypothetical protein SAMN05421642_101352 [Rhodococcus kyotonensis]